MLTQTSLLPLDAGSSSIIKLLGKPFLYKNFYSTVRVSSLNYANFPGRGKPTKETCGKFFKAYSCNCKSILKTKFHSCYKLDCPICYQKGINRSAERISYRFIKILQYTHLPMRHISFDTNEPINNYNDYVKLRKKINRIVKQNDLHGLLIFHAWRFPKKRIMTNWKTQPDRQKVKIRKGAGVESPHFHFIGAGYLPEQKIFIEKYGFHYSNITERNKKIGKPYKLRTRKAFKRLVAYLLSHAGLINGKSTTTWLNQFSYNRLIKYQEINDVDNLECSNCGSLVYEISDEPLSIIGNFNSGFTVSFSLYFRVDHDSVYKIYKTSYKLKHVQGLNFIKV